MYQVPRPRGVNRKTAFCEATSATAFTTTGRIGDGCHAGVGPITPTGTERTAPLGSVSSTVTISEVFAACWLRTKNRAVGYPGPTHVGGLEAAAPGASARA